MDHVITIGYGDTLQVMIEDYPDTLEVSYDQLREAILDHALQKLRRARYEREQKNASQFAQAQSGLQAVQQCPSPFGFNP